MLKTFALILFITGNDGGISEFIIDHNLSLQDCAAYQVRVEAIPALSNSRLFVGCVVEDGTWL